MDPKRDEIRRDRGRLRAVLTALGANVAVGIAKLLGFVVSGSASLLAEAIHSVADSANEALLLLGSSPAQRRANSAHPFGYGRERYFWSFVVAVVLFTGGGLFALLEAEEKLRRTHELTSLAWAIGILVVAMAFEGYSLRTAVRRSRGHKQDSESWFRFVRRSKEAELTVVLLEDAAALLGLAFALTGVVLAALTGNTRFDGVGSLAIGMLLVSVALAARGRDEELPHRRVGVSIRPGGDRCRPGVGRPSGARRADPHRATRAGGDRRDGRGGAMGPRPVGHRRSARPPWPRARDTHHGPERPGRLPAAGPVHHCADRRQQRLRSGATMTAALRTASAQCDRTRARGRP